jgi:hypothetical protein
VFARGLTCCSLMLLAVAAGCVARAAWAEFLSRSDDPVASLLMSVAFPAMPASQVLGLGLLGLSARQRWPVALMVFLAAIPVSAATVYCWSIARPTGPDAYEELVILRALGGLATMPVLLVVMPVVVWLVSPSQRRAPTFHSSCLITTPSDSGNGRPSGDS